MSESSSLPEPLTKKEREAVAASVSALLACDRPDVGIVAWCQVAQRLEATVAALESRLLTLEAENAALKAELAGALPDGAITQEKDGWWSVRGDVRQFRDADDARFAYMTAHARSTESSNG